MRLASACLLLFILGGAAGCRQARKPATTEQKTYHLRGKIVATDEPGGHITVAHAAIPGFMEAMTMSYKVAEPGTISELHAGDVITADVVVDYDAAGPLSPRLRNIVVVAQARPNTVPRVQYHVPAPGETVPDFHLLDQSGKQVTLNSFRGRVVLLTFIYTRCPLAEFCPRMSENFGVIDKALATDKAAYAKTHLLSISFDPTYDTPAVLRSYGGAHTGKFTDEDFRHWSFAAPSAAELPALEHWFDVGVTGNSGDPSSVMHSLSTVLIGKDGKVLAWYPTNDWQPTELEERMRAAAL